MDAYYHTFIHLLFIGIIALFPVVNPIGSALMVNRYFTSLSKTEKRKAVGTITLYAFLLCTVSLFAGRWILELFGISIPVIQLAGGIMICKTGWEFLTDKDKPLQPDVRAANNIDTSNYESLQDKLFFPITFPITTGAGTMSVLFTLSAHSANENVTSYFLNTTALMISIVTMCILVYILYLNTKSLLKYIGSHGEKIMNRIIAFLTFCVGLQIAVTGIKALTKM